MSNSSKRQLIVNADDFGFSAGISKGILQAHFEGIVTSTTVAANMPDAEAALAMLADASTLGVGVHLNASQGPALSAMGREILAAGDGEMNFSAMGLIKACAFRPRLLKAVEAEYDAQIRWVLDHGIAPTHLDTHRHAHGFGPIFRRVVKLAKRYTIPFIRRHRERLPGKGWPWADRRQQRVARVLNVLGIAQPLMGGTRIATKGTLGVAHTGNYDADWLIQVIHRLPTGVTELMVHPGLTHDVSAEASRLQQSRQKELEALCDPAVRKAAATEGIELIHYGTLHRT
jgi:predicted glycoside hydrolase/deacetylase ChbG (UPF0249 family)